jgi:hypothetical protein
MKAFTDYPFEFLGDALGFDATLREIEVLSYDGDKYCIVQVEGWKCEIKSGYIYSGMGREKVKLSVLETLRNHDEP